MKRGRGKEKKRQEKESKRESDREKVTERKYREEVAKILERKRQRQNDRGK